METPTETLRGLERRLKAILKTMDQVLDTSDSLSYNLSITWYEEPYNIGVLMGELDSSVQNIEAQLQIITERDR